jgi:hypothetical protein
MAKCDLPLHGLTVVVETNGPRFYVGRFDVEDDRGILLRDVDVRDLPAKEKEAHLAKTAKYGVFKNADMVRVPAAEVSSVRRLSEIVPEP